MNWIAIKMLVGDRAKYFGIIAGITFAALLIAQQLAIFCGLLLRTTSQLQDIAEADIWVMDPNVEYIDELKPMKEDYLQRVEGVPGVAWAVHFYKGQARLKLGDGKYQQAIVLGLDDATMVGAPQKFLLGSLANLRQPDAVVMDEAGYHYLWPHEPLRTGRLLEMNDHRAVLVGICQASRTFQTFPVMYTRYSLALEFIPQERRVMPFVLAAINPGVSAKQVCARIQKQTGLFAITRDDFAWETIYYYLRRTGIPINFGITVGLGFIVGCAIAGQTFYSFVIENQNQFGALKAMGVSNRRIVRMVLIQAIVVGGIGYSLGVGLATLFGVLTQNTEISFYLPWQVLIVTAVSVALIVAVACWISIHRVLILEPAVVFRN
jgi:putative ABC transport system permease protein